ncbi:T9SS type A sorting domain-containing protein [Tenacibaculum amylolyticum]|uniref:T9SS type A sorting domain-containing protein n=1 Tax=Tenacibaculum amylolyticum TaxID=104269 RepID=UPI003895553C
MQKVTLAGKLCLLGLSLLTTTTVKAQRVFELMHKDNVTLKEVQLEAEKYFKEVGTGKGSGYKQFKRWEYNALQNLQPDGTIFNDRDYQKAYQNRTSSRRSTQTSPSNWRELGPLMTEEADRKNVQGGIGRIVSIAVEPTRQQLIYAGAPGGGLWKSENAGNSWTPLGDKFPSMQVWAIAIDPNNTNTVYTGAGGHFLKSTDKGANFSDLATLPSSITDILVNPNNSNELFIAVRRNGLYHSIDGGQHWTQIINAPIEDVMYKPGSTSVLYACGNDFYKSINTGKSFTKITQGIVASERMKMAVSSTNPDYVYLVQKNDSSLGQIYRSTNSGTSFSIAFNKRNLLGSQAYRDMAITVSNTNANQLLVGGLVIHKSTDGAQSFSQSNTERNPSANNYVHADIEVLEYVNGILYVGSDGGIYKSTDHGKTYTDLTTGIGIQQFYHIASASKNKHLIVGGTQDNGSSLLQDNSYKWRRIGGADGIDCAIHPINNNLVYTTSQNGGLSEHNLANPGEKVGSRPIRTSFFTPLIIDPLKGDHLYMCNDNVFRRKTADKGSAKWVNISSNTTFGRNLRHMTISPANNNIMYVADGFTIVRGDNITTENTKWKPLKKFYGYINSIAVNPFDENHIAVGTSNSRVHVSTDGGITWTNISEGLPKMPVKAIVFDKSANKGMYVAVTGAVYFKNKTTNDWVLFNTNLPNVRIDDMDIFYGKGSSQSRIRIGTFGRGVWESNLYDTTTNGATLTCNTIVNNYPHQMSFETNFGGWEQNTNDTQDWTRIRGNNTLKASHQNFYIQAVATKSTQPKNAILTSPCYNLTSSANPTVNFSYFVKGTQAGTLALQITTNNVDWKTIWTTNSKTSQWENVRIDISEHTHTTNTVKFRLNALFTNTQEGNIAVDAFTINEKTIECEHLINSFPFLENFESGTLNNFKRSSTSQFFPWEIENNTTQNLVGKHYLTTKARGETTLESPCIDLTQLSNSELSFNYFLEVPNNKGANLAVEISPDGNTWNRIWARSDNKDYAWRKATVNLKAYAGKIIKLRFIAKGSEVTSANTILLDNISIKKVSTVAPTCFDVVTTFPYKHSFENGIGNWHNYDKDNQEWTFTNPSEYRNSRKPDRVVDGNFYARARISSSRKGHVSILETPCFDLSTLSNPILSFKHFIRINRPVNRPNTTLSRIAIEVTTDNELWKQIWLAKGKMDANWEDALVQLNEYAGKTIKLRFIATVGTGGLQNGDMAIDLVELKGTTIAPPSSETPNCTNTISGFPYNQSFENGLENWADATNDHFNWTRTTGRTPSNVTGPSAADHGNYYMFIEASRPNYPSKNAKLLMPCLDLTNATNPTLSFKYHMYGRNINRLNIAITTNDTRWKRVWTQVGEQGDSWKTGTLDLSPYVGKIVRLRFVGVTGDASKGDIAIDDIRITNTAENRAIASDVTNINEERIAVYPNPINDIMHVQLFTNGEQTSVSLYNTMGILIKTDRFETHKGINLVKLNVEELSSGMYILKIQKRETRITKKVLVK